MSSSEYDTTEDSDAELQEAFSKGLLRPGLNLPVPEEKKIFVNNPTGLKKKLASIQKELNWFERLDLTNKPAPMAPEMALQLEENEVQNRARNNELALNEFKRETLFHRQAQAAVLEGLARLKALGVPTKRPPDYFAEMAKSDAHMQKVRSMLVKKQAETERIEKARKMRQQKKLNKQLQKEGKVKKQNEKKEMLDEVKKFRKGIRKDLDFLENKKPPNKPSKDGPSNRSQLKKKYKDQKFGFGGKKRGLKANTRESSANIEDNMPFKRGFKKGQKPGKKNNKKNFRPGKSKRVKTKSKKKN